MFTGRAWLELPIVIVIGLVIGLIFGQVAKLLPSEPTQTTNEAKR
jgi:uncharacterized membrane-anchored protein YhcB (DUF1043 family)